MKKPSETPSCLVGQYFHSLDESKQIKWQGQVIGKIEDGIYLTELFEWISGEPSVRRIVKIEDMFEWLFYESSESMIESYNNGLARKNGPYRN